MPRTGNGKLSGAIQKVDKKIYVKSIDKARDIDNLESATNSKSKLELDGKPSSQELPQRQGPHGPVIFLR